MRWVKTANAWDTICSCCHCSGSRVAPPTAFWWKSTFCRWTMIWPHRAFCDEGTPNIYIYIFIFWVSDRQSSASTWLAVKSQGQLDPATTAARWTHLKLGACCQGRWIAVEMSHFFVSLTDSVPPVAVNRGVFIRSWVLSLEWVLDVLVSHSETVEQCTPPRNAGTVKLLQAK